MGAFAKSRVTCGYLFTDAWSPDASEENEGMDVVLTPAPSETATPSVIPAFSMAEAAVTLGRMLAQGSPDEGILPHPTAALAWYRRHPRQHRRRLRSGRRLPSRIRYSCRP